MVQRELGVSLENIKAMLMDPRFDGKKALKEHREKLIEKRQRLDQLIANVENTIASTEGTTSMSDKEKFEGFKKKLIEENEEKYGQEIREKYGDDTIGKSNAKVMNMAQDQYEKVTALEKRFKETLAEAFKIGDPYGELVQKAAELHKKWITYFWHEYSKEAHAGLAQKYVDDERFTAYYDKEVPGNAAFLRDAIQIYTGMDK